MPDNNDNHNRTAVSGGASSEPTPANNSGGGSGWGDKGLKGGSAGWGADGAKGGVSDEHPLGLGHVAVCLTHEICGCIKLIGSLFGCLAT